jgi:hypothetical protein
MFDSIKKALIQNREDDALLYEYVLTEIENEVILKGLWAKAMALSEGNDNKIRPLYMQYRVQSIKDEFTKLNIAYKEMTRDPLFKKITAVFAEPVAVKAPEVIVSTPKITIVEKSEPSKKPMTEMDSFFNESKKADSTESEADQVKVTRAKADIKTEKILKELGIDSATRAAYDAKTAKLKKELADLKAKRKDQK